ncbi:hypothetical protein ACI78R_18100 [Geodermatophilus sp. SYSU D01106]
MADDGDRSDGGAPFSVLFVCTGNICRSPLGERLARAYLSEALGADARHVTVASAGTRAVVGSAMHPDSALVLSGLGGDPAGFRARQLEPSLAAAADLVLVMTHRHRDVVLHHAPAALNRTFTVLEAERALSSGAVDGDRGGRDARARLQALVAALAARRRRTSRGAGDDVPDPVGRPLEVHQEVGERIADALLPLLDRMAAVVRAPEVRDRPGATT